MSAAAVLAVGAAMVLFVVGAQAVLTTSPSGFESNDGNMVLNTLDGAHTDWNCFLGGGGFQPGTYNPNCAVHLGATDLAADGSGEVQLTSGQKFDTACPTEGLGNNPPKDEFVNVAEYSENDSGLPPNTYFYGATIRQTTNGNSSGNVEFNQGAGNGTTTHGCRTAGDKLLAFDFLNGGTSVSFNTLTWITSTSPNLAGNNGTCYVGSDSDAINPATGQGGCWGAKLLAGDSTDSEGSVNTGLSGKTGAIAAADNGINGTALAVNSFAEFGVNLTKVLGLAGCTAFPQQVWESRSSGSSFTSNPQDIETVFKTIQNCGSITIIKHTDPRGADQSFGYTTTGDLNPSRFSLNDKGNLTADSGANTQTYSNVPAGQYTVTETAQTGYTLESLSCSKGTGTSTNVATATVTINLTPQDNVICTYTNQALGEIKIIKHTNPRGIDQAFSFATTSPSSPGLPATFKLNDVGNATSDSLGNTSDTTSLPVGSYTVTETEPAGWTLGSLSCTTGGSQHAAGSLQADITLTAGAVVTCTYTNNQPTGAIVITKTGKDKACTGSGTPTIAYGTCEDAGHAFLSGAKFSVTGTDLLGGAVAYTPTTGADGTACVEGLPWNGTGATYHVTETNAPKGYQLDNAGAESVTVTQNADCATNRASAATQSFTDTPLSILSVTAKADVAGTTNSSITCSTDGASFTNPFISVTSTDPATGSQDGLTPNTYYCKVVVDP